MSTRRRQRTYDHRLVRLVRETGDVDLAIRHGVPRSTAAGWVRREARPVVTSMAAEAESVELRVRVVSLERRLRRVEAMLRILLALVQVLQPDLTRLRVPHAADKSRLLRAIDRSRDVLGLARVLRLLRLSPSRLSAWRRAAQACELEDTPSCPHASPQRLTSKEIAEIRGMVTSAAFRHVPTGKLAVLAQRLGRVFASATTWQRLVRERGWRRPRLRVHPEKPTQGIRASEPDEIWHIDTTVIRLLDGARVYLHAVIDNFSRRILSWRLTDRFEPGTSAEILVEAGCHRAVGERTPQLLADGGVENCNASVDELIKSGLLNRVIAMTEIRFSNSLIEAWWRVLKHQWLFLHQLDSAAKVRTLVAFYVEEHNGTLPHSAFRGQTPDEMYFGTGEDVPGRLAEGKAEARQGRLEENRRARCSVCA